MQRYVSKHFRLMVSVALVIVLSLIVFGVTMAQQIPSIPKLPGGINIRLQGGPVRFRWIGLTYCSEGINWAEGQNHLSNTQHCGER